MSGTNRGSFAGRAIRQCTLLCCGVCMILSLAPLTDFDLDGSFDSLATDRSVMNAAASSLELPALLLRQSTPDQVRPAEPFSAAIPHPLTL